MCVQFHRGEEDWDVRHRGRRDDWQRRRDDAFGEWEGHEADGGRRERHAERRGLGRDEGFLRA